MATRYRRKPEIISTSGPHELPVACRVQAGKNFWQMPGLSTFVLVISTILSQALAEKRMREPSRFTGTRFMQKNPDGANRCAAFGHSQ
jgi:hypothetical protein